MKSEETFHCNRGTFCTVKTVHEGDDAGAWEYVRGVGDGENGGDL